MDLDLFGSHALGMAWVLITIELSIRLSVQ